MFCQEQRGKKKSQTESDGNFTFLPDTSTGAKKHIEISTSQNKKDISVVMKK